MVKMYIPRQASPRHVAPATAPATNVAIIVFSSFCFWFVLFVFVCFPCCVYIITRICAVFNNQSKADMLTKQHICNETPLMQQGVAKLSQNYCKKEKNVIYLP